MSKNRWCCCLSFKGKSYKFKKLINYNYDKKLFQKHEGFFNEYYDISHIYPGGGIVDNKKFLKILMKNVQFIDDFEVTEIKNLKGEKLIVDINGKSVRAKSVIWANGHDMKKYTQKQAYYTYFGLCELFEK